jgi:cellulose synthase/poly-beta-1,6-N-acetylglucosamine synthase-like glycosyltransferase
MRFIPIFDWGLPTLLFLLFACVAFLNLMYSLFIHGRLAFHSTKPTLKEVNLPPVSILIAARNEVDNLYENLPYILQQDYPQFEVIVINNQSSDESSFILNAYCQQYPNLRVIEVAKNQHLKLGKKLPITLGVKGAKYNHLLLTDADCKPCSNKWIQSMASQFTPGKELILGYGPYLRKKGFLNRLIRFETAWIAINYFSMAKAGIPYMGVGRNIGYTKNLFEKVNGFKSHYSLPSGDDDLFVQAAAAKKNYTINIEQKSYCYSEPCETWEKWIRQKNRHFSTSEKYKVIHKIMLGIYPLSMILLLICFVTLLFNEDFRWLALSIFTFLTVLKWWIHGRCFSKIHEKSFVFYLPLWDFLYVLVMPIIFYSSEKARLNKW